MAREQQVNIRDERVGQRRHDSLNFTRYIVTHTFDMGMV